MKTLVATLILTSTVALPRAANTDRDRPTPPPVPAAIQVPAGFKPFLSAHAIGKFTTKKSASLLDHATNLAHELRPGRAHLFNGFGLRLERGQVILAALAPHAGFGQRWCAERKLGGRWTGQTGAQRDRE